LLEERDFEESNGVKQFLQTPISEKEELTTVEIAHNHFEESLLHTMAITSIFSLMI
jgi:hypothetical protein